MPVRTSSKMQSAGLLLFRQRGKNVEVLLGHPGGPYWTLKDQGAWTIPKGLMEPGESPLSAAQREFAEETGYRPGGEAIPLGSAKQPGGKVVHVWAIEEDWDPADLQSNTFEMEWPPRSGRRQSFDELDALLAMRNALAHGAIEFHTPDMSLATLSQCADVINRLYARPAD